MDLSIVLVSWNTCDLLRGALASLPEAAPGLRWEALVVDNGSTDGSPEMVRREFPEVRLLTPGENLGFARANNLAFPRATGEHVLLLNPDTVCKPSSLVRLHSYLQENPSAGGVGPLLVDAQEHPTITFGRFPRARYHWFNVLDPRRVIWRAERHRFVCVPARARPSGPVDYVAGACLMIPRRVLDAVGPFDERFFLYFEETDWCWRAWRAGHAIHYCRDAEVFHLEGRSAARASAFAVAQFQKSYRLFVAKNYGQEAVGRFRDAQFAEYGLKAALRGALGLFAAEHRAVSRTYWRRARLQLRGSIEVSPPAAPEG